MKKPSASNDHQEPSRSAGPPPIDDRLKPVPELAIQKAGTLAKGAGLGAFVLLRLDALEKPKLEESLIEPNGGSACSCHSVCACVPVNTCACNEVCPCNTVSSCASYSCTCDAECNCFSGYCQCNYVYYC
jgi:hypothetical protein